MVIPRKWKVTAGAVSATMALGASAAIAEEGSSPANVDEGPILSEVVNVSELPPSVFPAADLVRQVEPQDQNASPFDSVSAESVSTESESAASEESLPSEESEASESLPSEESVSLESGSEESISTDD